jgi:hypothetical protein
MFFTTYVHSRFPLDFLRLVRHIHTSAPLCTWLVGFSIGTRDERRFTSRKPQFHEPLEAGSLCRGVSGEKVGAMTVCLDRPMILVLGKTPVCGVIPENLFDRCTEICGEMRLSQLGTHLSLACDRWSLGSSAPTFYRSFRLRAMICP